MNDEPEVGPAGDAEAVSPTGSDAAGEQLRKLLSDLADDPDAPATSVSGLSVIAAARAAGGAADEYPARSTSMATRPAGTISNLAEPAQEVDPAQSVGELHMLEVHADAARGRRQRRRTGLIALVAAASLAGVAAIVIPLSVSGGSTTSTAADSAVAASALGTVSDAGSAAAAGAAAAGAQPGDAGALQDSAASGGAAPEAGAATPERPPPGPDALTELVPADGVTAPVQTPAPAEPAAPTEASCWPSLSDTAAAALAGALPAGSFSEPGTLNLTCGPDPVGGATLLGTAPGTALVVRVSKADPGACARGNSEAGVRCVPRDGGVYVATDSGGAAVAFAYGNGNEVVVGGAPVEPGAISAPKVSGLSADQLVAAAQAVLAALG